jgi:hypothetical protein
VAIPSCGLDFDVALLDVIADFARDTTGRLLKNSNQATVGAVYFFWTAAKPPLVVVKASMGILRSLISFVTNSTASAL